MDRDHIITTVSEPGFGKSLDLGSTLPRGALVHSKGALGMLEELRGFTPPFSYEANDLKSARKCLRQIAADPPAGAWGVGLDDLSLFSRITARELEAKYPKEGSGVFDFFNAMSAEVEKTLGALKDARDAVAAANGTPAIAMCTAHPSDGVKCKIGPWFEGSSWKTIPFWVKHSGIVAHVGVDPKRPTEHKGYYWVRPMHPQFFMKDRTHIMSERTPMSMGEVLRAYGFEVPYSFEADWAGEWVEAVAAEVSQFADDPKKFVAQMPTISKWVDTELASVHPGIRRWIKWDGLARWEIRKNVQARASAW